MTSVEWCELFEKHSVSQLKDIKAEVDKSLKEEKDALKAAVGSRYKDFLDVADKISDMKQRAQGQNLKLSQLSFSKASYNRCDGLAKFNSMIRRDNAKQAKQLSKPVILRHMINILSRKVSTLDVESEAITVECLTLSKTCHCLRVLLSDTTIQMEGFEKVKSSLSCIIMSRMTNTAEEDEDESVLNLVSALCALNNSNTLEALTLFLQVRLSRIEEMNLETDFQQCLLYAFNTIGWFKMLRNKLAPFLSRHMEQSEWTGLPILAEWNDWFDCHEIKSNWGEPLSSKSLEKALTTWKATLAAFLAKKFHNIVSKPTGATRGVLHQILLSFKNYTSLADMSFDGISLVERFLDLWSVEFENRALAELSQLSDITQNLLLICTAPSNRDRGPRLFQENQNLVNYKDYLENIRMSISNQVSPSSQLVKQLDSLHSDAESYAGTLASLDTLSASLNRQVLSVDDYENPDFWATITEKMSQIRQAISEKCAISIRTIEKEFLEKVQEVAFSEIASSSKTGVLCFLRVLSSWKQKKPMCKMFIAEENAFDEQMENLYAEALLDFCQARADKITSILSSSIQAASDEAIVSTETQLAMYRLCLDLIEDEAGNNYGEIFLGRSFQTVKPTLVSSLLKHCQGGTLSGFADMMFIALFSGDEVSQNEHIDSLKKTMLEKNIEEKMIEKCYKEAVDQYKRCHLVFLPLSIF